MKLVGEPEWEIEPPLPISRFGMALVVALIAILAPVPGQKADAATITVNPPDAYGRIFVDIVGDIGVDDNKVFLDKTGILPSERVYVTLSSDGGNAVAAEIGNYIRLSGMKTLVPEHKRCLSVCAIIWLGARDRYVGGDDSTIGFHGAYDSTTGQPANLNLMIAVYLGYLGFSYDAVAWMLTAPPMAMRWLTQETAKEYNIYFAILNPPRTVPFVTPPLPPAPQAAPLPPAPQAAPQAAPQPPQAEPGPKRPFRVVSDDGYLNIRKGPGPAYDVITKMRSGDTGTAGHCVPVGGNYLDFCEVEWQGITGWASSCCIVYTDQSSSNLSFFCITESGRGRNPQGDGIIVQATEARAGWSLHVVHKVGGQLYDRNVQYEVSAFRQDQNRPSYYWDGMLTKDRNVLMTGHLWLNAGVWLYNEYISFRDGSQPLKLATPPVVCQPTG